MITVKDFLEKITNPDRIKIVKGEEVLFTGYKGALVHEGAADLSPDILEAEMVSFRIDPEIRAKDWKARGLMAPDRTGTGAGLQVFRSGNETVLQDLYIKQQ